MTVSAAQARQHTRYGLSYASFEAKVVAYLLDLLVLAGVLLLLIALFLLPLVFATDSGEEDLPDWAIWAVIPIVPAFILFTLLYYVGLWLSAGQTIGQMIVSIRVVRRDGYKLGLSRAFLRYLALAIPSIFVFIALFSLWAAIVLFDAASGDFGSFTVTIGIFLVIALAGVGGFIYSLFDAERRGLHDILAGTVVVEG
ncbi:MAG: RDD family protein [Dehalococcoidia bacterium]